MTNQLSLFIFRRDLRVVDNTGLLRAMSESMEVVPLFICTPKQLINNKYKSSNSIQFMMDSLYELDKAITKLNSKSGLWINLGDEIEIIEQINQKFHLDAIYVNEDYSPYSLQRDSRIKSFCQKNGLHFYAETDILLTDRLDYQAKNGNYYRIFGQFYRKALEVEVRKPVTKIYHNFRPRDKFAKKWRIDLIDQDLLVQGVYEINPNLALKPGRKAGLDILKNLSKFRNYKQIHDVMHLNTTQLSAHNKFGTVSIREVYQAVTKKARSEDLARQLYWRDFYYYVSVHFPQLYRYEHIYKKFKGKIQWENKKSHLKAWQQGRTGFPIVDACMRQLNQTGYMHNRGRLIVSSFLVKDLLVDWKYGDIYFSQKLVDVDRSVNTGNWNWTSSYGLDSSPFLRILNPWDQAKRYDPECEYIKRWIPELKDVPVADILKWDRTYSQYESTGYGGPIVDHAVQRDKFKKFYYSYFR